MKVEKLYWIHRRDRFITSVRSFHPCMHGRDKSVPTMYPGYLIKVHRYTLVSRQYQVQVAKFVPQIAFA